MKDLNAAIRAQGVIWHPCSSCDRDWPFPKGADGQPAREWKCSICCYAELSKMKRAHAV